jgi:hypothetical protein
MTEVPVLNTSLPEMGSYSSPLSYYKQLLLNINDYVPEIASFE